MPGRLAGLVRFVRLIFTPERLDEVAEEAPDPEVTRPTFLRSLAARETLETAPPPSAGEGQPRSFVREIFARDTLPTDDPADATPPQKAFVRTLLGRETLGEDPPADTTSQKPRFLRWVFTGPELGTETDGGDECAAPEPPGQE